MRCVACNTELDDGESTNFDHNNGQFVDMCRKCIRLSNTKYTAEELIVDVYGQFVVGDSYITPSRGCD